MRRRSRKGKFRRTLSKVNPKTQRILLLLSVGLFIAIGYLVVSYGHASSGYNVVGNEIIGPNGKQWTPYGFVLECLGYQSATATTCQPTQGAAGTNFTDTAKISATGGYWHGNAVRLQIAQENLFPNGPTQPVNQNFVAKMDNEVQLANSLGLVAVLTLQEEEWNGPVFPTQSAVSFWQWMASHYKDNPDVMFDLYNEPQLSAATAGGENNLWNIWQNGGTAPGNGVTYVGFQALVNAIRGEGANTVVIAESNNYDKDLSQVLTHQLTGGNVAYGVEVNLYSDSRTKSQWIANFGQYTQHVPIMPEAFRDNAGSTCDTNSPADVPALFSYLQSIHMGAFAWMLAPGIATNNQGLDNPTTYPAPGQTISCPASLSDISSTNTTGPGNALANFFAAGTSTPATPTPTPPHTSTPTPPPTYTPTITPTPSTGPTPSPVTTGGGSGGAGGGGNVSVGPPDSHVSVDGVAESNNGQLDTSYLTNGAHTITITANGQTSTKTIYVHNKLNPFETLRNFLFARYTQNHLLMNAGTIAILLILAAAVVVVGAFFAKRLPPLHRRRSTTL